ncbi:hypothetical protein TWF694_010474 [Orbilia ellipsospora]|uniref:Myb-like DNA-binding domain-containing protein n=1 Tax=Orbilia ellipsospora TaxID=2528407 RepID=A0AAV9XB55_9PEZI
MVGVSISVSDKEFLLCCIEHAKDIKIDYSAVAKDLGYSSNVAAANRMRAIKKKIEAKKSSSKPNEGAGAEEDQAADKTPEKVGKPEPKRRGRKRKSEAIAKEEE